ncbi:WD40 repeat-like protein [Thozetella sp. PMI_491]|nr:WD40 repeat-like protein [Thozetella sp. PMI_491]
MDDDDRDESGSENEQDEMMEDADEVEQDNDAEEEENENENENEDEEEEEQEGDELDADPEPEGGGDADAEPTESFEDARVKPEPRGDGDDDPDAKRPSTAPGSPTTPRWRPKIPPEYITARTYDIMPTMAAPQATSINALAVTPDLRFWITGGSDGYIRKYDGVGTINGKQLLTVAQRHPFVDSVTKAGILMSYWENEELSPPNARVEEHVLSPVYSLAVHSQALWLLSGLESGGINLQSVRHDEGKRIHCLQGGHTNAVSMLSLAPDEKSVLSGSWDKNILDWDLNTGQIIRRYDGSGGQISALELRPAVGGPIPAAASEVFIKSDTISSNNDQPIFGAPLMDAPAANGPTVTENGAPAGSPEHESLFGSPAGSLFGDNDAMGGNAFGGDDDDEFSRAMEMTINDEPPQNSMDQSGDFTMQDAGPSVPAAPEPAPVEPPAPEPAEGAAAPASAEATVPMDLSQPGLDPNSQLLSSAPDQQFDTQPAPIESMLPDSSQPAPQPHSPSMLFGSTAPPPHHDSTQVSATTFLGASIDGNIRIWDRRVPNPVARINNRPGVPPWCMGACWSPDGNWIYAGRRNGTVEEFSIQNAWSGWTPERTLKFPGGSGAVSCVRVMPNGRHLICASHDILRLYDLHEPVPSKGSKVPFLIIPGPPRPGVIANLYIDPTSRFMISIAGTRGWEGASTETLVGYEINVPE